MQEDLFDKKDFKKFQNRFSVLPINTKPQSFIDVVNQAVPFYKQIDELLKRDVDFSNKKDVEIITRLLTSSEHSKKDLQVLKKAFGELKFFKETQQNLPANDYTALINELKCEKFDQFETVFSYDDFGYKYYIILKGSVYVLIPNPEMLKNQKQQQNQADKKQQQINDSTQQIPIKNGEKQQSSRKASIATRKPSLNLTVQIESSEPSTPSPIKKQSFDRRKSIMKQQTSQFQQIAQQQQQQQLQIEEDIKIKKKNSIQVIQDFFDIDEENQNQNEENGLTIQQLGALSLLKSKSLSPVKLNRRTTLGQPNLVSGIKKLQMLLKKGSAIEEEETEPIQDPQLTEQQIQNTVLQQNFGFDIIKTLKVGDAFGEIALMNNARRTASIICKEETIMVTLSKQSYDKILSNYHQKKFMESVNFLKEFSFFANWQNSKINGLYQNMEKRAAQYKEIIYKEGDNADFVYFIKEGEFEVTKTLKIEQSDSSAHDQFNSLLKQGKNAENRKAKISVLGIGSSFGEEEIVMGTKRACSVQCISSTAELYILHKSKFIQHIKYDKQNIQKLKIDIQNRVQWRENLQDKLIETDKIFKENKQQIYPEPINIKDFKLRQSEQVLDEDESEEEVNITATSPLHKKRQFLIPNQQTNGGLSPISPNENKKLSIFMKGNPQIFHQHPIEKIITLKEENARTLRNTLKSFSNLNSPIKTSSNELDAKKCNSHVPLIKFKSTIQNIKQASSQTADNSPQIGNSCQSQQLLNSHGQRVSQNGHFISSLTDVELDFTKLTMNQTRSPHIKNLIDPFYEPQSKQSNRNLKQDITLDKFSPKKGYTNTKFINSSSLQIPFFNEKITQSILETEQEEEQNQTNAKQNERLIKLPKDFQNLLKYTTQMSNVKDKQSLYNINNFQFAKSQRQSELDSNSQNMIRVNSLQYSGTLSSATTQDPQISTYQSPRNSENYSLQPPVSGNRGSFNHNSFLYNSSNNFNNYPTITAISFTNLNQATQHNQKLQQSIIEPNKSFYKDQQELSPSISPKNNKRFRSLQPLNFTKQLTLNKHLKQIDQVPQQSINNNNTSCLSIEKTINYSFNTITISPQSNKIRKNLSQIVLQTPTNNSQTSTFSSYISKENKTKLIAQKSQFNQIQGSLFKNFQIKNNDKSFRQNIETMTPIILSSQESIRQKSQKQKQNQELQKISLTQSLRVSIAPQN
ncbi:glycosyl hydrolase family 31 protein (macronuclear) [Tetrahymena thermophila SB210]|uniref:Glycosyl hydrolase family 31 protein n=1 Tax=Tetrahymena thermophila (strain SB210) TaxID=312017 RepID=I7LX89_TETTS|nr:glycosyl hydrolase family 31 protein [Tetrahymena thermophila SB210]EAS03972.2 glycosyl hydrolase family 31 protein [Tetrahymena thermophila SB210]|eukprot:XP_001024217.2 glycosyl hydrolase family 31 protein [Tetrahymena thermophila SB210]